MGIRGIKHGGCTERLAATAAEAGEPVATFDEDFAAFPEVTRHAW